MHNDVKEILLNEEEIAQVVSDIAAKISEDYKDKNLLLVCVLKGSICFMADLMRKIDLPLEIEFLRAKSYLAGSSESCGNVEIKSAIDNLSQYDVVVVEDIFDTGRTLEKVKAKMIEDGAKSVRCCSLLDKPERRDSSVPRASSRSPSLSTLTTTVIFSRLNKQLSKASSGHTLSSVILLSQAFRGSW